MNIKSDILKCFKIKLLLVVFFLVTTGCSHYFLPKYNDLKDGEKIYFGRISFIERYYEKGYENLPKMTFIEKIEYGFSSGDIRLEFKDGSTLQSVSSSTRNIHPVIDRVKEINFLEGMYLLKTYSKTIELKAIIISLGDVHYRYDLDPYIKIDLAGSEKLIYLGDLFLALQKNQNSKIPNLLIKNFNHIDFDGKALARISKVPNNVVVKGSLIRINDNTRYKKSGFVATRVFIHY